MFDIKTLRSNQDGRQHNFHIYIQVPFCHYKCPYCCFMAGINHADLTNFTLIPDYLKALQFDIDCFDFPDKNLQSIVFGGGTPTILAGKDIESIFKLILGKIKNGQTEPFYSSFETTPDLATYDKLSEFYNAGMRRVSLGIQSYNPEDLKLLGRSNTPSQALEAFDNARKAGFSQINIDLLMNFPGSSFQNLKNNLDIVFDQSPEFITTNLMGYGYSGAEKYEKRLSSKGYSVPPIDKQIEMYSYTFDALEKNGYEPIDFVVFAKKGLRFPYEVHGLGMSDNIVAFGPSVLTALPEGAYYAPPLLNEYINNPISLRIHSPFSNNVYPIMHGHLICNGLLSREELEPIFEASIEHAIENSQQSSDLYNRLDSHGLLEWVEEGLQFRQDKIVEGLVHLWDYQRHVKKTV